MFGFFVWLIHRPMRTKNQLYKNPNSFKLRFPISSLISLKHSQPKFVQHIVGHINTDGRDVDVHDRSTQRESYGCMQRKSFSPEPIINSERKSLFRIGDSTRAES